MSRESGHHPKHAFEALKIATEHSGAKGALAGAAGVALTAATALGVAGMSLTPLGLVVVAGTGAAIGGTGLLKKLREFFD